MSNSDITVEELKDLLYQIFKMKHVEKALINMKESGYSTDFIEVTGGENSTVKFTFQSGPVAEVGKIDGCQIVDMIIFSKFLLESLNNTIPCRENFLSIYKLEEAVMWQEKRTQNRTILGTEGKQS